MICVFAADAFEVPGMLLFLFLAVVGFAIAVAWIVFPFIVISKCNEMIKLLRRIDNRSEPAMEATQRQQLEETTRMRQDFEKVKEQLGSIHEAGNQVSVALQWMIDNWDRKKPD